MRIDVLIDVSNICRDHKVPPVGDADLRRYDALEEAARQRFGRDAVIVGVADANLVHDLPRDQRRRYNSAIADGTFIIEPKADVRLLRLADEHDAVVLAADNFKDHRKEFPWIAHRPQRFWSWDEHAGHLTLASRTMPTYPVFELSRAADLDDLYKGLKLDATRLEEVLHYRWRCTNAACISHKLGDLAPTPRWDGERFICAACASPMRRGAERRRAVMLKISGHDGAGIRQVLERGAVLRLGRTDTDLDLTSLSGDYHRRLSGSHASLAITEDGGWQVTDLGSRNGTWIGRWDLRSAVRAPWARIDAHTPVDLDERDAVLLSDIVRIDRSGVINPGG